MSGTIVNVLTLLNATDKKEENRHACCSCTTYIRVWKWDIN